MPVTVEKTGKYQVMNRFISLISLPILLFGGSINTHIFFTGEPTVSIRTITQAFNAIGYKSEIHSLVVHKDSGEFSAKAIGNKVFNASALGDTLTEEGIRIEKALLDKGELTMVLDTQNTLWNVPLLEGDDGVELKRVNGAQWFQLKEAQRIRITPPYIGKWYPDIAVYDRSMALLSSYRLLEPKEEFQFDLPYGAYYLKVSNTQGMKLLKEGMWIESMRAGE